MDYLYIFVIRLKETHELIVCIFAIGLKETHGYDIFDIETDP